MRRAAALIPLLASACVFGVDTATTDARGSLYGAEIFCAPEFLGEAPFAGVRVTMVPGPELAGLGGDARGCVRLGLAQTTQGPFDVAVNEGFVFVGGSFEATADCRVNGATSTTAIALTDAVGVASFDGGPQGSIRMNVALTFGDLELVAELSELEVRVGGCDVDFD